MINLAVSDSFRTAFPKKPDFVFQLYTGERKKGNIMTSMNQTAKHYIMEQFEKKKFKRGYTNWNIFKNKYDNSKKKYTKYRKLMCSRTGLGFDEMRMIYMSDDWWSERQKVSTPVLLQFLCLNLVI